MQVNGKSSARPGHGSPPNWSRSAAIPWPVAEVGIELEQAATAVVNMATVASAESRDIRWMF